MKKKFLAILLACAALFTAGCGSIGTNSSQWIDSSIKGNVTADTVVSLKDDFAAAANQALYASGESEGRTIVNISRMVTDRKRWRKTTPGGRLSASRRWSPISARLRASPLSRICMPGSRIPRPTRSASRRWRLPARAVRRWRRLPTLCCSGMPVSRWPGRTALLTPISA